MEKAIIYIHGKGGNIEESAHYKPFFNNFDIIGFDYQSETPWEAKDEFTAFINKVCQSYDTVFIIANSIGAFFVMNADMNKKIKKAFFISPIVNMERLIKDMMTNANITENELHEKKEIKTPCGDTISWKYLNYVRNHPLKWNIPTHILYGEKDTFTSFDAMTSFAKDIGATLDIMKNGEHWFHTKEQMEFLDKWILVRIKNNL